MTTATVFHMPAARTSRWLVVVSLALNLFFIGIAGAMAVRNHGAAPAPAPVDRRPAARIERLSATLPQADAERLRGMFQARSASVQALYDDYRHAQDAARETLRTEPFAAGAMDAALAKTRAARLALDEALQGLIATSAATMSADGRRKLADYPGPRPGQNR